MLSKQQRMDSDLEQLRNLMEDLRSDLKTARSAQVRKHTLMRRQLLVDVNVFWSGMLWRLCVLPLTFLAMALSHASCLTILNRAHCAGRHRQSSARGG
jgi:hypothetical protein